MQGATECHHQSAAALLPQAAPVFDDTTTRDTAMHRLAPSRAVVQRLIGPVLLPCQRLALWFRGWHEARHLGQRERQEAQSLSQPAVRGPGRGRRLGHPLLMDTSARGVA
jgi:hypothetical protein